MTQPLKTAWVLLTTAAILAFALTGFTLLNIDSLQDQHVSKADVALDSVAVVEPMDETIAIGKALFNANCKSCHGIENGIIGPPLKHVYSKRDSAWLRKWITNSSKLIAAGDPEAVKLFEEYNRTQMTNFSAFDEEHLNALLLYLDYVDKN
jgi:mono/diheme cytochrome c family protein